MFRAPDPWDVDDEEKKELSCGYGPGLEAKYERTGQTLGKGGFGSVAVVKSKATGVEYACKSISKLLDVPNISPARQEQHLSNIKQEVSVLRKLRGTLNVVHLEDVFEDEDCVHIVMELCRGGELLSKINSRHYSERTVASYMRAVLRTLAQCHHHRILHRDIKPGNFMLLTDAEDAPVKAIDFGLAVFFDAKALPVRNLGLEGTPHYMAPEVLSSEVYPESDVWAAGVMAYQLMSGQFPFDDWKNPRNPALSQLWKSILTEEPKFSGRAWQDVSDGAKDFIRHLLVRDVHQRPSAQQALTHPWIQGKSRQRKEGKPLAATIVQRLQRFSTENAFKRTVLDMIANELLARHMQQLQKQQQRASAAQAQAGSSPAAGGLAFAGTEGGSPQGQSQNAHSPPQATTLPAVAEAPGEARQASPPTPGSIAAATKRLDRLRRDPSSPHLRSLMACSLISQLHHKSATVHAGGAAGMLLQGASSSGSGAAGPAGAPADSRPPPAVSRDGSLDLARATGYLPPSSPGRARVTSSAGGASGGSSAQPLPQLPHSQDSEELTLIAHMPMPEHASPDTPPGLGPIAAAAAGSAAPIAGATAGGGGAGPQGLAPQSKFHRGALPHGSPHPASPLSPAWADGNVFGSAAPSGVKAPRGVPRQKSFVAEGSGHALSHYAFLLAAGERSLHGLSQRQMQRSQSHASLGQSRAAASQSAGPAAAGPSTVGTRPISPGARSHAMPIAAAAAGSAGSAAGRVPSPPGMSSSYQPPSMLQGARPTKDFAAARRSIDHHNASSVHGATLGLPHPTGQPLQQGSLHGVDEVQRLLLAVQRQRQEHRKLQRLMLDTSGHAQNLYMTSTQGQAAGGAPELAPVTEGSRQPSTEPSRQPSDNDTSMSEPQSDELGDAEQAAGGPARRKSILHKVSSALLKPVKDMLGRTGSGATKSGSTSSPTPSSHVSGAFGSTIPSAEPSTHAGAGHAHELLAATAPSTDGSQHKTGPAGALPAAAPPPQPPGAVATPFHAGTSAPDAGVQAGGDQHAEPGGPHAGDGARANSAVAGAPSLSLRPSLTLQEVMATERHDDGTHSPGVASPEGAARGGGGGGDVAARGTSFESGGRGRGAYAALVATLGPAAGGDADGGAAPAGAPAAGAAVEDAASALGTTSTLGTMPTASTLPVASSGSLTLGIPPAAEAATPSMGSMAIHTVKAHKRQPTVDEADIVPAPPDDQHTIAAQLARIEQAHGSEGDVPAQGDGTADGTAHVGGTVSKGKLYDMLGHLLGGPAQLAEFQAVMHKLNYDKNPELSFDEISQGLQVLGYRLEPSEVAVLLSEVALGGQHISQGAFLASQVDWRQFQANHRDEWLSLLRNAFDGLARDTDGRIGEDEIVNLLKSKLPEDEVNLAVQETLLDAAVLGAEGLDFDDFARLLAAPSETDLLSLGSPSGSAVDLGVASDDSQHNGAALRRLPSIDLYDARMLDSSQHGRSPSVPAGARTAMEGSGAVTALPAGPVVASIAPSDLVAGAQYYLPPSWLAGQIDAGHAGGMYHPGLETVPDEEAE